MLTYNMRREDIESLGQNHAGIVRAEKDFVMARVLGDIMILTPKNDISLTPSLITCGYWESWITSWFTRNSFAGMHMLDVGANVGYFSAVAAELGAAVVTAIEPNAFICPMLQRTAAANGYPMTVYPHALSDKKEYVTLSIPENYIGSGSIIANFEGQYETETMGVPAFPLDSHPQLSQHFLVDFIKIDAEGAEERIWDGMQQTLTTNKPLVVLEYTSGRYSKDFPEKLEAYGALSKINHAGWEDKLSPSDLETFPEFEMVVIRP